MTWASHLDAVRGSSERQSVTDAVMCQEPAGATGSAGGQGKAVRRLG